MIRTPRVPFIQSHAAPALTVMTLAIMGVGIYLPMGPLAEYFKLQALPPAFFPWLAGILVGYCVLTTLVKCYYIRRFGWE
jgi:Mg2+-importing ATPase